MLARVSAVAGLLLLASCGPTDPADDSLVGQKMTLTSAAFPPGGAIPAKYTSDGADVSPPLTWTGTPAGTKTFALVCDDPDAPAGTWVHWVLFDLSGAKSSLDEGSAGGGIQGRNDFGKNAYGGPAPPDGTHRYYFKVYALDAELPLKAGATREQLLAAAKGHTLGTGVLMGRYTKR